MARTVIAPADLDRELARLGELSLDELKARYEEITGTSLPKFLRSAFAELVVGHALQCRVLGGLDRETRKRIEELMAGVVPAGAAKPRPKNKKLRSGTRLIREWRGRLHEVVVTQEGYLFNNQSFGSLTEITGTKWNGWVFFGLKVPKAEKGTGKAGRRSPAQGDGAISEEAAHG